MGIGAIGCTGDPVEASSDTQGASTSAGTGSRGDGSEESEPTDTTASTSAGSAEASSSSPPGDTGAGETSSTGSSDDETQDSTGEPGCQPKGPLVFDEAWSYYSNPADLLDASLSTELELIPDDDHNRGAAVLLTDPPELPFRLTFEYTIFDDDGGHDSTQVWSSGDGLVVMVLKDPSWYEGRFSLPPTSTGRGFAFDGTGLGVQFEIYGTRRIVGTNGSGTWLTPAVEPRLSAYPHGEWREVVLDVSEAEVVVHYEGNELFTMAGPHDTTFLGLGFGAGTGAADGSHRIRNVMIDTCR